MILLTVPLPPTSNHRLIPVGGRQIKSPEYRAWMDQAAWLMRSQLPSKQDPIATNVVVTVGITFPDRRKRDIDNVLKPVNDAMVKSGVLADDSYIKGQIVYRDDIDKNNAKVEIGIYQPSDKQALLDGKRFEQMIDNAMK